jgi:DNA (cytosine-5)-methyltransferase 1
MTAYYNEFDQNAAAWLRELIKAGHIADGEVDTRSISDVTPDDLRPFTQCHFFAGIGGWSLALRLAQWPDTRPVWTGSCPCQPFSVAGRAGGFDDERHLWPHFHWLIEQRRPSSVFGEQVASRDGLDWLDLVRADLEGSRYAFGAADLCAAGFGAPHIRQRLFWVAHAASQGPQRRERPGQRVDAQLPAAERDCQASRLADATGGGWWRGPGQLGGLRPEERLQAGGLADSAIVGCREERADARRIDAGDPAQGRAAGLVHGGGDHRPGPTNGFWRAADWLGCRDGKWRPVEPGTFPLAHGLPARVGRLRGYGNAIVPEVAAAFVRAAT